MAAPIAPPPAPLLTVEGLAVRLPDGRPLLDGVGLLVAPGEVVAILGASGSGKSTLVRAVLEPAALTAAGFRVGGRVATATGAALVPQQGAPLDHLDVRGNVRLPLRWQDAGRRARPESFLDAVGLPASLGRPGVRTGVLSGGQRQRLAVARALAAGRRLMLLDEPSAGLDPAAVAELADLLRRQAGEQGAGLVVVTHDTRLAARAADRVLVLEGGRLVPVTVPKGDRAALEAALTDRGAGPGPGGASGAARAPHGGARRLARLWERTFAALELPPLALARLRGLRGRHLPELGHVAARVLRQALVRPSAFYALVSTLLGFTLLYVLTRAAPAGLSPEVLLELVGGSYVLALAPAFSAILFAATSGAAVNAWLGSLALGRQIAALEALGIRSERYLWLPAFLALVVSYLAVAALVAAGLILGGALVHAVEGVGSGIGGVFGSLAGDLIDPVPERQRLRARALWLTLLYGPGLAADVVRRGAAPKDSSEAVTRAMTGSVIAATLWVVALELASALVLLGFGEVP